MQTRDFRICLRGDKVETAGSPTGRLGHKLTGGDGLPDGVFFEWDWNGERLVARNDRLGIHPAFWALVDNGIAIADNAAHLVRLGADNTIDAPAMAAFLHLGFFLAEDTPFQAVRALPPGAELTWTPGGGARVDAPSWSPLIPYSASRPIAMENYAHLFRDAINRRSPDRAQIVLPLSGGRDSRHILFELIRAGIRPRCFTAQRLPPQPDEDIRVAKLLVGALGLQHELVGQTDCLFEAEQTKNRATGFCSDEGAWQMSLGQRLIDEDSTIYDGLGGDVLSAGLFATPRNCEAAKRRDPDEFALACVQIRTCQDGFGEDVMRFILSDRAYAGFGLPVALDRIRCEAVRYLDFPNPVAAFFFFNRTRREIALFPLGVLGQRNTVYCPYLDYLLVQFLLSLPMDLVSDHRFHTETIALAFPEYAAIPYEDKAVVGLSATALHAQFTRDVARSALRHGLAAPLRRGRVLPRLLRALVDRRYAAETHWYAGGIQYINQLDSEIGMS